MASVPTPDDPMDVDIESTTRIHPANNLPDEVLLQIFEALCPDPVASDSDGKAERNFRRNLRTLRALQCCSRRFYNLATPIRYRNLRVDVLDLAHFRKILYAVRRRKSPLRSLVKDMRFNFKDHHRGRFARQGLQARLWSQTCTDMFRELKISSKLAQHIDPRLFERIALSRARPAAGFTHYGEAMRYIDIDILLLLSELPSLEVIEFCMEPIFLDNHLRQHHNWQCLRRFVKEALEGDTYLQRLRHISYSSGTSPRKSIRPNEYKSAIEGRPLMTTTVLHELDLDANSFPAQLKRFMVLDTVTLLSLSCVPMHHTLLRNLVTTFRGIQHVYIRFNEPTFMSDLTWVDLGESSLLASSLNAAAQLRSLRIEGWSTPENGWDASGFSLAGMTALEELEIPAAMLFGSHEGIKYRELDTLQTTLPSSLQLLILRYVLCDRMPPQCVEPHMCALMQADASFPDLVEIWIVSSVVTHETFVSMTEQAKEAGWNCVWSEEPQQGCRVTQGDNFEMKFAYQREGYQGPE
ncbi:hypothetical protein AMS68_002608 [Peltaster fructicola]|uniref:Uncharacterized protein n=1 Tax=Peltaster fructicola TaxID=286661 RepID=A0A6H0XR10_9PEZI|nr:hypothetical protein AMS68_002608 [Peltaster fructicola]